MDGLVDRADPSASCTLMGKGTRVTTGAPGSHASPDLLRLTGYRPRRSVSCSRSPSGEWTARKEACQTETGDH